MNLRSRKTGSLAGAILRVTLLIGVITITATVAVSLASSYRLARAQAAERQQAYLRVAESAVTSHLNSAVRAADRVTAPLWTTPEGQDLGRVLATAYVADSATIEGYWLVTRDAARIATYPAAADDAISTSIGLKEAVADRRNGFYYDPGGEGRAASLWVMRPVKLTDGTDAELVARVRTDFLTTTVDQIASAREQRAVAVTQRSNLVAAGAGGPVLKLTGVDYGEIDDKGLGPVELTAPVVGDMRGYYLRLEGFPGLPWHLLVAEPSASIFGSSLRAITPTVVVLVIGGLVAIGLAWLLAQRLVHPLREVESASLEAAAGAYVPQLKVDREDEVGRLSEAFNVLALRLNALHDVSRLLASASKTSQVLHAVVESVIHLLGPGIAAVYLRDAPMLFHLSHSSAEESVSAGVSITRDSARVFERCVSSGALLLPPTGEVPSLMQDPTERPGRVLVAPLVVGEEGLGVVVVEQPVRRPYTEAELEMVRTFTAQAGVALLNSRVFEEERVSREVAEALHLVAERLVRPVNLGEALASAADEMSHLLRGRDVVLAIRDRAALGLPHTSDPIREGVILELAKRVAQEGTAGAVAASAADEATVALLGRLGASSVFIEEMAPGTPYAAALAVLDWEEGYSPSDFELIDGAAKILDLALENAYFVERDRSRARNLETIFRISQAVGSSLEVRIVLNRVLDVVQMIFAADAVSLMTYDESRRVVSTAMARGSISEAILHFETVPGEDLPGRVFTSGTPARIAEIDSAASGFEAAAATLGLRSVLSVPLLARGRPIGVLSVLSATAEAFDEEDMGLLQTFASQAALAIDTARMYGRERDVAEVLQQSILPDQLPEYPEVESASAYQPAGLEAEIGGDYYDMFRGPDGSIVVAMADVCGKGVSAATKTSMIKYSIRALVAAGLSPATCMQELNDLVAGKGDPADIVTVVLGFLDMRKQILTWSNGGHPPGLLLRAETGGIERIETTGPLLGAMLGARFEESKIDLKSGDVLLLYTDGVSEARKGDRFFGEGRIRRVLKYGGSAEAITQRLLASLHRFAPGDLRDDVAVLAVRVCGVAERRAAANVEVQ